MRRTKHIAWREIAGQAYVINTRTSMLHEMNEEATFIWKQLENGASPEVIAGRLTEEYTVTPEQARNDVREFLETLTRHGLVEPVRKTD
jgi:hypothetical protein